jgi:hypothetical protein
MTRMRCMLLHGSMKVRASRMERGRVRARRGTRQYESCGILGTSLSFGVEVLMHEGRDIRH